MKEKIILIPAPRTIHRGKGTVSVPASLEARLARYTLGAESPPGVEAHVGSGLIEQEQGYRLSVGPDGLTLMSGSEKGLFYGYKTLLQLVRQADERGEIPCVRIEDWPEFPARAVMLGIAGASTRSVAIML